ncbi:pyridoxal phosphate-dependent aminotransferase [Alicyclobacillus dauci]|uniref:Aminotransferase class I/II-fold pyridoxal phosphate-dependent enzyme n=1 Tax=Alicyclobacillus dauci TaxID=1475485 RepID=A0ABY6YZU6_9BACL|nr:aminotransferase class I/II-fold pyridoxal phosphate-dependent enzyme [Alicyclobacillus dauci]WAH36147.1 aminotransferase class I/II-fold pyridoxal phosphate-dependent enzyme [Alicyclobacillus dauci]
MHGGRIYEYAERMGVAPNDILDFSANINPLGPPDSVMAAIHDALHGVVHYPDSRHQTLKQVLAASFGIENPHAIFVGNGASEVIDLTIRAVSPNRVFVFEPAFSEYHAAAHRAGAQLIQLSLSEEIGDTVRTATPRPTLNDMVIINNPHNPTGMSWGKSELMDVIAYLCSIGVLVMVDESFMDFRWDHHQLSVIENVMQWPTLVVIRSATKMYSIPGLRFGSGIAHPDLVRRIEQHRDKWSVNHLAQAAAIAAYQGHEFVRRTWDWLQVEQEYICGTWGNAPWVRLYPPSVNYFLVQLDDRLNPDDIRIRLENEGIFVRWCAQFENLTPHHMRIAIKLRPENERLWEAFHRIVASLM